MSTYRYYVSFTHANGNGNADIDAKTPISTRADVDRLAEYLTTRAGTRVTITAFSRYDDPAVTPHTTGNPQLHAIPGGRNADRH